MSSQTKAPFEVVKESFPHAQTLPSADWPSLSVPTAQHRAFFENFKQTETEHGYDLLVDVTAVDEGVDAEPRFTAVYHFYSTTKHGYLRVKVACAPHKGPGCENTAILAIIPTVADLWPTADWHERETYDMFGIEFTNHPDMRRILMWDAYPYFPLRKDFPLAGIETELPAPDVVERTGATVKPAPMMGGPFHAKDGNLSEGEPRAADESWNEADER